MAWTWNQAPAGIIKGTLDGTTNTLSIGGISGNAILKTPDETVELVNIILDIGGKEIVVDEKLTYTSNNEVISNE